MPDSPSPDLAWAGGPLGRYAVRSRRGVDRALLGAVPLALGALLTVTVALLRLQSCLAQGWVRRVPVTRMCSTDLAATVGGHDLGRGVAAYLAGEVRLDQPPLTGLALTTLGGLTHSSTVLGSQRALIVAWALLAVGLLTLIAARVAEVPGAQAAQVVLSPVVALTVLLGPDVVGVALATLGLLYWMRSRPMLAGALLGAGTMARTYPLLVLAVLVALLLGGGAPGRREEARPLALGALAGAGAVAVPFAFDPSVVVESWRHRWDAPTSLGSIWHLPALAGASIPPRPAALLAVLGWAAALCLVGVALTSRRRPSLPALVLAAVALVLVAGKAFPVHASLWLVPLAALAGVRWRDHLAWAACEVVHLVALDLYLNNLVEPTKGLPAGAYALVVLLRVAGIAWLARAAWVAPPGPRPAISGYAAGPGTLDRLP